MTEETTQPNEYPVNTITDITQIPEEALPRFLAELPTMIKEIKELDAANALIKELFGEEVEIPPPTYTWIDDGENEITREIRIQVKEEGE